MNCECGASVSIINKETGMNQPKKKRLTCLGFGLQILMSVDSMRLCVVLMASVRTDWVPSDASVTRATRSPRMAKAVWVSVYIFCIYIFIIYKYILFTYTMYRHKNLTSYGYSENVSQLHLLKDKHISNK